MTTSRTGPLLPILFAGALLAPAATSQPGVPAPPGLDREAMWPAPTAADWRRPCLVTWQRTWEDAVTVARETGKPILVCVNMDGEIASEHYAGIRYRQPDIAALYEPYVTVIASVYRHTPRDHDEQGRRIPCPRFGSVTCGEHIAIEPILFEKFFDGRRVAPRHIMVELDGAESYDVYFTWDTQSVFDAIRGGIEGRAEYPSPVVRGDRSLVERVASRDIRDRQAVEQAYREGDRALREALLEAAKEHPDAAPLELLRLALFGLDPELAGLAREALARTETPDATDLLADALQVPMDPSDRAGLIDALERVGEESPRARTLAVVHRGLTRRSSAVDAADWAAALAEGAAPAVTEYDVESRMQRQDQVLASDDPDERLELAEAFLSRALDPATDPEFAHLLVLDGRRTAREAELLGASGWRLDAALAVAARHLGDLEEAHARAEAAVRALPPGATEPTAAAVLELFAGMRWRAIVQAGRAKEKWPGTWLTDMHDAGAVLARHPRGTDGHVAWLYDRLLWLGAAARAHQVLDDGLQRFPGSPVLHDRHRTRLLKERGAAGLEAAYEEWLARPEPPRDLEWFAGYASIVAAEFLRRAGADAEAVAAYGRAVQHYERAIAENPESAESADHYAAVALGGRARVAFEAGDLEQAVAGLLAAFERSPESANTLDGLNLSAVDTAKMVRARLREAGQDALAERLEAGLAALDPALLELPAYEREVPPERPAGERRGDG